MANRPELAGSSSSAELLESQQRPGGGNDGESNASGVGEKDELNQQEEEEELQKLESEVNEMAQRFLDYSSTLPDQLKSALAALLAAQRPELPCSTSASEPGPSNTGRSGDSSVEVPTAMEAEEEASNKLKLVKEKIASNASAMPLVIKRMKDCISRLDKINSSEDIIHPVFKRRKS